MFNFEIQHRPGKSHGNADGLSRRKCARPLCPDCRPTMEEEGAAHLLVAVLENEGERQDQDADKEGLLYVAEPKREVKTSTVLRLVAPLPIRRQIFKEIHQARTGGHQGINNTISVVRRHFFWPGLYSDVRRWCQQCEGCARAKTGESGRRARLVQDISGMPMDDNDMDIDSSTC